ncbi:hypothetical protein [Pantoea stewartii]|uniref:hypothetical protein n=1 Tax=Pantoea stewartii TaxID=66269 RepID=UPI00138F9E84|nr:hypothetical protein [Pantoea stewartii]
MTFNFGNLTTPENIDQYVASFCRSLSTENPVFIDVKPELWCKQSNCEMNVDKYIEQNGGEKVFGYKIWYIERKYIEAERHAVYRKDGVYRDVTFNTDGETIILFVPDSKKITYDEKPLKTRHGLTQKTRLLAKQLDLQETGIQQMSQEDSWNTMPSYEDWLKGTRMPNLIPVAVKPGIR